MRAGGTARTDSYGFSQKMMSPERGSFFIYRTYDKTNDIRISF